MVKIYFKNINKKDESFLISLFNRNFNDYGIIENNYSLKSIQRFIKKYKKKLQLICSDNIRIGIVLSIRSQKYYFLSTVFQSISNFDYNYFIKNISNNKMTKNKLLFMYKDKYTFDQLKNLNQKKLLKNDNNKIIYKRALILGPKKRNENIIRYLRLKKIKVFNSLMPIQKSYLKKNKIDVILSSGYAFKIPKDIVNLYKKRIFNLHATFLPWGKGIGTTFYSFLLDQPVGVSIHLIEKEFDTGDILVRKKIFPNINDTTRTFYGKLLKEIDLIFFENFNLIFSNNFVSYKQTKILNKVQPYFSRLEFEKLYSQLSNGYDTFLYQLSLVSYIQKNNKKFKQIFIYEK